MPGTLAFAAVILASITLVGLVTVVPLLQPGPRFEAASTIQYVRTGGFAGVNDTLMVDASGGVTYSSRFSTSFSASLAPYELSHLKQLLAENLGRIQPQVFQPKGGAADFFSYSLTAKTGNQTIHLSWVDEWASSDPLPGQLKAAQRTMQDTIDLLRARATFSNTVGALTNPVSLTIYTDKKAYKMGEQVQVLVAFANMGPRSVNYTSPTPCDPDVRISVAGNNQTKDLSYSETPVQACIQVLQQRSVGPNGTVIQRATWTLSFDSGGSSTQAKPGTYTITARFPLATFETVIIEARLNIAID